MTSEFDLFHFLADHPVICFLVVAAGIVIGLLIIGNKWTTHFEGTRKSTEKPKG